MNAIEIDVAPAKTQFDGRSCREASFGGRFDRLRRKPPACLCLSKPPVWCGCRQAGGLWRRSQAGGLRHFIDPAAFFLLLGIAGVENDAIAGFERAFEGKEDRVAAHGGDGAEIDAALFSKPGVNEGLVVSPAKPAG